MCLSLLFLVKTPLPPEPNLSSQIFVFPLSRQWNAVSLSCILPHTLLASIYPIFSGHLRCLFISFWFSHPLHELKIVFVATEQLTLCRSVSLGQNHCSCCWAGGVGVQLDNILSVVQFVILKCSGIPWPPDLCEASVDITKNFTLQVRQNISPKGCVILLFTNSSVWLQAKQKHLLVLELLFSQSNHVTF